MSLRRCDMFRGSIQMSFNLDSISCGLCGFSPFYDVRSFNPKHHLYICLCLDALPALFCPQPTKQRNSENIIILWLVCKNIYFLINFICKKFLFFGILYFPSKLFYSLKKNPVMFVASSFLMYAVHIHTSKFCVLLLVLGVS